MDEYASYLYFLLTPPSVPSKEGSVLEIEVVVEISKLEAARGSVLGRMSMIGSAAPAADEMMTISLGCLTITGNAIDQ
jgi:hypothetical protein